MVCGDLKEEGSDCEMSHHIITMTGVAGKTFTHINILSMVTKINKRAA